MPQLVTMRFQPCLGFEPPVLQAADVHAATVVPLPAVKEEAPEKPDVAGEPSRVLGPTEAQAFKDAQSRARSRKKRQNKASTEGSVTPTPEFSRSPPTPRSRRRLAPALWATLSSQVLWDLTTPEETPMQLPLTLYADDNLGHWLLKTTEDIKNMDAFIVKLFRTLECYGLKVNPEKSSLIIRVQGYRLAQQTCTQPNGHGETTTTLENTGQKHGVSYSHL